MKMNITKTERVIRFSIAIILLSLFAFSAVPTFAGLFFFSLSGPFFLTSFVGFCPFYALLDMKLSYVRVKHL